MCQSNVRSIRITNTAAQDSTQDHTSPEGNTMEHNVKLDTAAIITECQRAVREKVEYGAYRLKVSTVEAQYEVLTELVKTILEATAKNELPTACEDCGQSDNEMVADGKCELCFVECRECEKVVHRDEAIDDDLCNRCGVQCCDCGAVATNDEAEWCSEYGYRVDRDDWFCEQCGAACESCGTVERRDDMGINPDNDDECFCESCSTECATCDKRVGDDFITDVDGNQYCPDCADEAQDDLEREVNCEVRSDVMDLLVEAVLTMRGIRTDDARKAERATVFAAVEEAMATIEVRAMSMDDVLRNIMS